MWRCRWIISIWFCVTDLSEDPLLSRNSRYPAVPQPGSRSPLLQELLLRGIHRRIPPPRWLRYHLSEAGSLPYHARRRAQLISTRRLAIIIQIQIRPRLAVNVDMTVSTCFLAVVESFWRTSRDFLLGKNVTKAKVSYKGRQIWQR